MYKQSPSRNQRSKGIKAKYVLQIFVLLAVCFWLIYQVKRSHDKKKEFDEEGAKILLRLQHGDAISNFGRKDIRPRLEETTIKNEKLDEEEAEEEETGGEDEKKHEEEKREEDSKAEEEEDEGRGGGDDEIDERDQDKSDMEIDGEEDILDVEKESEEGDDKESEEMDADGKEDQIENESSMGHLHDADGGGRNAHEAREEHYKADDASSAVTHDTQTVSAENEEVGLDSKESTISEQEVKVAETNDSDIGQNSTGLKMGDKEMSENSTTLDETVGKQKGFEIVPFRSEYSSPVSPTMLAADSSDNQAEVSNNSSGVTTESHGPSLQNGTDTILDSVQAQNNTMGHTLSVIMLKEWADNSNTTIVTKHSDSNSTLFTSTDNLGASSEASSNSSTNSESAIPEMITMSNAGQEEKSDTSNKMDGINESSKTENEDEVQHDDPIDSSDSSVSLRDKNEDIAAE